MDHADQPVRPATMDLGDRLIAERASVPVRRLRVAFGVPTRIKNGVIHEQTQPQIMGIITTTLVQCMNDHCNGLS